MFCFSRYVSSRIEDCYNYYYYYLLLSKLQSSKCLLLE